MLCIVRHQCSVAGKYNKLSATVRFIKQCIVMIITVLFGYFSNVLVQGAVIVSGNYAKLKLLDGGLVWT